MQDLLKGSLPYAELLAHSHCSLHLQQMHVSGATPINIKSSSSSPSAWESILPPETEALPWEHATNAPKDVRGRSTDERIEAPCGASPCDSGLENSSFCNLVRSDGCFCRVETAATCGLSIGILRTGMFPAVDLLCFQSSNPTHACAEMDMSSTK